MIAMVDGEIPSSIVKEANPNNFGVERITPLTPNDVLGKDYIIVMGLYNENWAFDEKRGSRFDMYPKDSTYCGKFNYLVKRIKDNLRMANNTDCKLILVTPHIFGKYPFNNNDAYHYLNRGMIDSLKVMSSIDSLFFCDLTQLAGIDSTNWNTYHSCSYMKKSSPHYRLAKYPQNQDCLHLNKRGQMKIAVAIGKWMSEEFE